MILSVCIPVYNNIKSFEISLYSLAQSIMDYEDRVEIVVVDNASEDDIESVINNFQRNFTKIKLSYHRNLFNIGGPANSIKAVKMAKGEFVWIIGSDDFVYPRGIESIINEIERNQQINFIGLNLSSIDLTDKRFESFNIKSNNIFRDFQSIIFHKENTTYRKGIKIVDELVNPLMNTVMLGAVMASVFKREVWNQFDFSELNVSPKFDNLESIYPHIVVFANEFMTKPAAYIDSPVVIAGEGHRSWDDEDLRNGPLLFIYFDSFPKIVSLYKINNLDAKVLRQCRKYIAYTAGYFFSRLLYFKLSSKSNYYYLSKINFFSIIKNNVIQFNFYKGLITYLFKKVFLRI